MGGSDIRIRFRRRFKTAGYRYSLFTNRFGSAIRSGAKGLGLLAFIASVLCIVSLVVMAGYDHRPHDLAMLRRLLQACQITFIIKVLYNLVLRFRHTSHNTHTVKWIADIAVLISLLPLIYPRPEHPWIPAVEQLLYSRRILYVILA
ncbi:MAG: hypothetical protein K2L77_05680, partial [Muribaculaceae bacterium]|nr:hypothetical protein [Muribaculaceae bacterium]